MPIRRVKQYSDRGNLKDLVSIKSEDLDPPTSYELRLKALYEHSLLSRDPKLANATGFIVMTGSNDRAGYPVSLYRHREYINSLSAQSKNKIEQTKQELLVYLAPDELRFEMKVSEFKQKRSLQTILDSDNVLIKMASANTIKNDKRSFRRVSNQ